ncbi:MAG: Uma2 family endonuclease [Bacteroidota bacterium]
MPAAAAATITLTPEEYFAWEARQEVPHEYADGEVFPMPGGTFTHFTLILNIAVALRTALGDRDAHVLPDGMRLMIHDRRYVYPDVQVVLGDPAFRDENETTLTNPAFVVEVLSDSTAAYDRGEKFALYRDVESIREVVFVDPERRWVEVARRTDSGWLIETAVTEGEVQLHALGLALPMEAIYEG